MKAAEMVIPTPEIINEVKSSYNRLLKRQKDATKYLDDPNIPDNDKEKHLLAFKIEIVDPMSSYFEVLREWGVKVTDEEILGGMQIE